MRRERKNKYALVIVVLLLCVGGYAYYQYQTITSVRHLDVDLRNIAVTNVTWTTSTVDFTLSVYNPNKIPASVGDFNALVQANGVQLSAVALPAFTIRQGDTLFQSVTVTVSHVDAGLALFNAFKERQVDWNVQGQYTMHLPFGFTHTYDFSFSKST